MEFIVEIIKSIVFGIVQGITEWLPISSTGHLLLLDEFLQLDFSEDFVNTFFVVIQLGSILAVVVLYWQKLWPFGSKKTEKEKKKTWNLWFHILVACIPAGILGVLFDDIIDEYLYTPLVIALALIVYGVLFIIIENRDLSLKYKKVEQIDYSTSFKIGMFQCLALVPGTSRSGSTILGGRLLGCSKESVSEFSFFVAIPIMAGASLLKLIKAGFGFGLSEWIVLLVGTFTAFIVSIFAIKFLLSYIRKHDFKAFGIYRIILGVLVILYFYVIS